MAAPTTRYVEMSEKLYDEISAKVRASYPKSCIVWIEENVNPGLLAAFEKQRDEVASTNGDARVVEGFHGTREENISQIAIEGFDPVYNKTSAHGKGTYFARDAAYSFSYMHPGREQVSYMFLCDVILGKSHLSAAYQQCPKGYDSFVDRLQNPSIYVTPYRYGAFPKYIIAFYKSAPK
jgi:Poly(ADP-ribose) polymerase catalytic domain